MNSFPFESINTGNDSNPVWDRAITAEMERNFNKLKYTNGVFAAPVNGLLVTSLTGMTVKINAGGCHIGGAIAYETNQREITLPPASNTLARIDRIVCRLDTAEDKRNVEIYLKEGVPATTPSPQELIRQDNYFEIALADIYIPKQSLEIVNSYITDQRLNTEVCGLVLPAIPFESQTEELWNQIKESIDLVNSAVDGTTAGHLENLIDELQVRATALEAQSDALNTITTNLSNNAKVRVSCNPQFPNFESNGLKWEKFSDGTMEVVYQKNHTLAFTSAWGGTPIYQTASSSDGTTISIAPAGLISVDDIKPTVKNNVDNKVIIPTLQATSISEINITYACGYTTATLSRSATIYMTIKGRWK